MKPATESELVWHESSAIWELIAGELVIQSRQPPSGDLAVLMERAASGARDAATQLRGDDLDSAGHALIGCTLALALAARADAHTATPIENYASELAAAVSFRAARPSEEDLERLENALTEGAPEPRLWDLAIDAGAHAAGLSASITRRRERRDQVSR